MLSRKRAWMKVRLRLSVERSVEFKRTLKLGKFKIVRKEDNTHCKF